MGDDPELSVSGTGTAFGYISRKSTGRKAKRKGKGKRRAALPPTAVELGEPPHDRPQLQQGPESDEVDTLWRTCFTSPAQAARLDDVAGSSAIAFFPHVDLPGLEDLRTTFACCRGPTVHLYEVNGAGEPVLRASFDAPTADAAQSGFDLYERGERREMFMSLAWTVLLDDDEPPIPVLAVAGRGRLIHILDGRSLRCHRTLSGHGRTITSVAFSDEYEHALVSTSHDRTAMVWDLRGASADDECVAMLSGPGGHTDGLLSAAWHPCLPLIVTTGVDCFVALWSVADTSVTAAKPARAFRGQPIQPLKVAFPIWATRELHVDWPIQSMWVDEYTLATIARTRDDLPFDLPPELDDGEDAPLKSPVLRAGRIAEREDHELVVMCPRILLDLDSELLDADAPPLHEVDDPGPQSTGILNHRHSAAFVELSRTIVPHQLDWSAGATLIPGVGIAVACNAEFRRHQNLVRVWPLTARSLSQGSSGIAAQATASSDHGPLSCVSASSDRQWLVGAGRAGAMVVWHHG